MQGNPSEIRSIPLPDLNEKGNNDFSIVGKKRNGFQTIVILILLMFGIGGGLYYSNSKGYINFNFSYFSGTVTDKENRGYGDFAYINDGEIYLSKFDGTNKIKLTDTQGKVGNLIISPDNKTIAYTLTADYFLPQIYKNDYYKVISGDKNPLGFDKQVTMNTELYIIDLPTKKTKKIADKLNDSQYYTDIIEHFFNKRDAYYSNIGVLNFSSDNNYIIYSRDNDIDYNTETNKVKHSSQFLFASNIKSEETINLNSSQYIDKLMFSTSGKYLITTNNDTKNYFAYDSSGFPTIVQKMISSNGTTYIFKGNEDTVIEEGFLTIHQGNGFTLPIHREINPTDWTNISETSVSDFNNREVTTTLLSDKDRSITLTEQYKKTTEMTKTEYQFKFTLKSATEEKVLFDSGSTNLSELKGTYLALVEGKGGYTKKLNIDTTKPQLLAIWNPPSTGEINKFNLYIYDMNNIGQPTFSDTITSNNIQFFY